jgi:hypothetical protein
MESFQSIYDQLTEEEKQLLSKIEEKMGSVVEEMKDERFANIDTNDPNGVPDFSEKHPDIIHPKHVTIAPHEITFSLKAEVSEVDDKGYLSSVKEVVNKYYHVPVKAKEDWELYMNKFFEKFHNSLENVCQELNQFKK